MVLDAQNFETGSEKKLPSKQVQEENQAWTLSPLILL